MGVVGSGAAPARLRTRFRYRLVEGHVGKTIPKAQARELRQIAFSLVHTISPTPLYPPTLLSSVIREAVGCGAGEKITFSFFEEFKNTLLRQGEDF